MHVGIVGGGYAGRMAAVRLSLAGHRITLIDANEHWVERTRLHQAAATGRQVRRPHRGLLDTLGAGFHRGRVVGLHGATLHLDDGTRKDFDRVVLAVGSVVDRDGAVGVREHALALGDPEEASRIHARVAALAEGAVVVVVGAGLTGLELAAEVAEAHPRLHVRLIGDPARDLSPSGARSVRRSLDQLGIEVLSARVHEVAPRRVQTDRGALDADLVLWAGGMRAPAWLARSGLPVDARGQLRVDAALRVVGHPGVVAAGDCAATGLRMACAVAMPLGCHAAETLIREARGLEPLPFRNRPCFARSSFRDRPRLSARSFRFAHVLRCISLGRRRGLVQTTSADDAPRELAGGGRPAAWLKEVILGGTVHLPRWEARLRRRLYAWPTADLRHGLSAPREVA